MAVASEQRVVANGNPVFISFNEQIIAVAEFQNGYLVPKFQL
jgi:hypothetical protein